MEDSELLKNTPSVPECLKALGVSQLIEWDIITFLYRHEISIVTAALIGKLIGGDQAAVSAALGRLESEGLIHRSCGSQNVHLYRISIPADPWRSSCFRNLMGLAEKREGRLLLRNHLSRTSPRLVRARGMHID